MKWLDCQSCSTEFRVVSDSTSAIEFCPYCGDPMDIEDEEDEDYDFDD